MNSPAEFVSTHDCSATGDWAKALCAAIGSGLLMAGCYWPLNLHFLAWIAMVPLLLVLPRLSASQATLYGTIMGLVFYRLGLDWLFSINPFLAIGGLTALSLLFGLAFRVSSVLMKRFGMSAMLWAVPLAFVGQEILRSEGLSRYRFGYVAWGYTQAQNLWVAQLASFGGVYFVSLIVVAFNVAVAYALLKRKTRSYAPTAAVAMAVIIFGFVAQPPSENKKGNIPVACVQLDSVDYSAFMELVKTAVDHPSKPRLILLPEHTIAEPADKRHSFVDQLSQLAQERDVYICVGAHTSAAPNSCCYYDNVAMLIGPGGRIDVQSKAVPLPFFEDGNPARAQNVFTTSMGTLGLYVCYDGDFTDIGRRLENLGAEILVVPVMNPAHWRQQQQWQQADMAAIRSIETRRWSVRAASTGISQIVDPTGRTVAMRTKGEGPGVLYGAVARNNDRTLFARGGYIFAQLLGLVFLGVVILMAAAETWNRSRAIASHPWRRRTCPVESVPD